MNKAIALSVGMLLVMALVAPAGAGTIFSAGFEQASGYNPAGALPSGPALLPGPYSADGYYPNTGNGVFGTPASGIQWALGDYSSNPADAPDPWGQDAFIYANPNLTGNPSNQVMAVIGDSSDGPHPTEIAANMNLNTTNNVTLSLKTYYSSTLNAGSHEVAIMSFLGAGLNFGTSHYYDSSGDNLCFSFQGTDYAATADAWHDVVITFHQAVNPANDTADLSLDGSTVATGVAVNASWFTGSTRFNVSTDDAAWSGNANLTGAILLDNIQVTQVPEPATLALLALGGIALLRRRRK